MPAGDLLSLVPVALTESQSDWVNAGLAIAIALAAVQVLKRVFDRRGARIAAAVARGQMTPEIDTRLRLLRRLLYVVVVVIGIAVALSQFEAVRTIGRTLLASGALAAAIIGFAARQTLANIVAGIMLAITQPVRVGDWVKFEDDYGVVEDVTLSFTMLRTGDERRVVIPNEKLASSVIKNDTLVNPVVGLDVSVWIPPEADAAHAVQALQEETGHDVRVVEAVPWGTRLALGSDPVAPPEKFAGETALRARALARLRAEGLLREAGSQAAGANPPRD